MTWTETNIIGMIVESHNWSTPKWYVKSVVNNEITLVDVANPHHICRKYKTFECFVGTIIPDYYKGEWFNVEPFYQIF